MTSTHTTPPASAGNGKLSTLTGPILAVPSTYATASTYTASYDGASLLTGSCTEAVFALITDNARFPLIYPQVGCGAGRPECCPYDIYGPAVLKHCPEDYVTTSHGCCPSGWSLYNSGIGTQTPCYSDAATPLVPAVTPDISNLITVSKVKFASHLPLASQTAWPRGIVVGLILAAVALVAVFVVAGMSIMFARGRRNDRIPRGRRQSSPGKIIQQERDTGNAITENDRPAPLFHPPHLQNKRLPRTPLATAPAAHTQTPISPESAPEAVGHLDSHLEEAETPETPAQAAWELPGHDLADFHPAFRRRESHPDPLIPPPLYSIPHTPFHRDGKHG